MNNSFFLSGIINPDLANDAIRIKLKSLEHKLKIFLYENGKLDPISRRGSQFVEPIGEHHIKIAHIDFRNALGYGIDGDPFSIFYHKNIISKRSFMDLYSRIYYLYRDNVSNVELERILLEIEFFSSKVFNSKYDNHLDSFIQGIQNILSRELRTFIRKKEIQIFIGISKKISYNEKMGKKPRFKTLVNIRYHLNQKRKVDLSIFPFINIRSAQAYHFKPYLEPNKILDDDFNRLIRRLDSYILDYIFDPNNEYISNDHAFGPTFYRPEFDLYWFLFCKASDTLNRIPSMRDVQDIYTATIGLRRNTLRNGDNFSGVELLNLLRKVHRSKKFNPIIKYQIRMAVYQYALKRNIDFTRIRSDKNAGFTKSPSFSSGLNQKLENFPRLLKFIKRIKELRGFPYGVFIEYDLSIKISTFKLKGYGNEINGKKFEFRTNKFKEIKRDFFQNLIDNNIIRLYEINNNPDDPVLGGITECMLDSKLNKILIEISELPKQIVGSDFHDAPVEYILEHSPYAIISELIVWMRNKDNLLTGHIDLIMTDGEKIFICDHKPNEHDDLSTCNNLSTHIINSVPQLVAYAKCLKNFCDAEVICVAFNNELLCVFDPEKLYDELNEFYTNNKNFKLDSDVDLPWMRFF